MSFSQRYGYKPTRSVIQVDGLDKPTRIALWNSVDAAREEFDGPWDGPGNTIAKVLWSGVLAQARDEYVQSSQLWRRVKAVSLEGPWNLVFDVLEALVEALVLHTGANYAQSVIDRLNTVFGDYLVGFRFIGPLITPLDTTEAVDAVDEALSTGSPAVRHHFERARDHLASRTSPDYANSIKESISAVESAVRITTGKTTLGDGLKELRSRGTTIHPALERAWSGMYGWTSDEDGIRHGGITAPDATQGIAKYMLITCSAFVSYLLEISPPTE